MTRVNSSSINQTNIRPQFRFKTFDYLKHCHHVDRRPPLANRNLYVQYYDPFYCECRAYGRLKEEKREDLVVRAYGYLILSPDQQAEVARKMGVRHSSLVLASWDGHEEHYGLSVPAIVKELVTDDFGEDYPFAITEAQAPQVWSDLKGLHGLGIRVGDIREGNYVRGKLVDFGRAWTVYHPGLMSCSSIRQSILRKAEARSLVKLFKRRNFAIPRDLQACSVGNMLGDREPTGWDWRKDDEAAVAHVDKHLYKTWSLFSAFLDMGAFFTKILFKWN